MLTALDRIIIATGDLPRAQREMIHVLGRSPSWVGGYPGDQTESVLWKLDNLCIELLAPVGDTAVCQQLRERIDSGGGGVYAVVLACEDIAGTTQEIRENGLHPTEPTEGLTKDEPSGAYRRFLQSELDPSETAGIRILIAEHLSEPGELSPSLSVEGDDAAVFAGDHVVIMTAAPERALALFSDMLGIRLALDKTFEGRKTRLIFFRLGGFTIEIGAPLKDPSDEPPANDRLWGIAYKVNNIEATADRITRAGLETTKIRDGNKSGTRVFTVKNEPAGVPTLVIKHD